MTIEIPLVFYKLLARAGISNTNRPLPIIYWDKNRLHLHPSVVPSNCLFNVMSGEIYIDKDTYFGHNCMMLTGKHTSPLDVIPEGRDIYIGKRCWICSGAIILGNVRIGDDCTIAAGSIVTKDVPAGTIVKGVW